MGAREHSPSELIHGREASDADVTDAWNAGIPHALTPEIVGSRRQM